MVYREIIPPAPLRGVVECLWVARRSGPTRVLPDGCMDLLLADGDVSVAGPDTSAFTTVGSDGPVAGLRFRPGVLPRLLGVPAVELRDSRAPLVEVAPAVAASMAAVVAAVQLVEVASAAATPIPLAELVQAAGAVSTVQLSGVEPTSTGGKDFAEVVPPAVGGVAGAGPAELTLFALVTRLLAVEPRRETAPWSLPALTHATARLRRGAPVSAVAAELGRSERTLARQCAAVYGYGPAVLRRVLRFRAATDLLHAGVAPAEVAARTGYADQPHLTREVRALAGVSPGRLRS